MSKESLRSQEDILSSVRSSIRERLVGTTSPRREQVNAISEFQLRNVDLQTLLSLGLELNQDAVSQLNATEQQLISEHLTSLSTEILQADSEQRAEMSQVVQIVASNPSTETLRRFPENSLAYRIATIIMALMIGLSMNVLVTKEAKAQLPTITPTPVETPTPKKTTPKPTATAEILPTVTPTPETVVETIVTSVTTDNVNARKGPGTTFAVETVIPEGTTVTRIGEPKNGWVQISFELDGETYGESDEIYVSVDFLSEPQTEIIRTQQPVETATPEASPTVTATETITSTDDITSSTVLTGEVDTEAVGGTVSSVLFDANGFPTSELINGEHTAVKVLTSSEFSQLTEIEGNELIEELPKQVAIANADSSFEVIKISQGILENLKFAVTQEGIYAQIPVDAQRPVVMKWEGGIEYRADWVLPQFEGQKVSVALSSAYNDIHPTREVIIRDKKLYIFQLHNGTIAETMASEERKTAYVNNSEYLAWYQEFSFIEDKPTPIPYSPEYESSIKFDNLVTAMWDKLASFQEGKIIHFPKLDKDVDTSKKVNITLWRFPDDEEGKLGWNDDAVSPLPQHYYQISEEGSLTIHVSLARTSSHNLSAVISGAVSQMLVEEFGMTPDYMDQVKPMFRDINNSVFDLVNVDANNSSVIVLPVYVDAGEEKNGTWSKLE